MSNQSNTTSFIKSTWRYWPAVFVVGLIVFIGYCIVRSYVIEPPSRVSMTEPNSGVGIEPQLDAQVPLELQLKDEQGNDVLLADYVGEKPVLLSLVYYECPMLCGQVMSGLIRSLRAIKFDVGEEFEVLTVSFDPREGPEMAAKAKQSALDKYGRDGAEDGWHFLTGGETQVRTLANTVGFYYKWDEPSKQYAHGAGIFLLQPDGKVSHYFNGIEYKTRDLELGLVQASNKQIGTVTDQILLLCYHYDPSNATFGFAIWNSVRLLCVLTLAVMAIGFVAMGRRRMKQLQEQGYSDINDPRPKASLPGTQ